VNVLCTITRSDDQEGDSNKSQKSVGGRQTHLLLRAEVFTKWPGDASGLEQEDEKKDNGFSKGWGWPIVGKMGG